MDSQSRAKSRWKKTLESNIQTLGKHSGLVKLMDYDTFDMSIQDLVQQNRQSNFGKLVLFTSDFLEPLRQFTKAITTLSQTNDVASFIWGSIQVMLQLLSGFSDALDNISGKLCELVRMLPLLEEYRALFPEAYELDEPLRSLYQDFISFCINSINFLKGSRWRMFRNVAWNRVEKDFTRTTRAIQDHKSHFMESLDLARTRLGVTADRHIQHITANMATSMSPLHGCKRTITVGIPFGQNTRFQGRDKTLKDLHACLQPREPTKGKRLESCVIHGMAGVGKTQTALEYTYRYREDYSYMFWVRAESVPDLVNSFSEISRRVLPNVNEQNQMRMVELVREWLEENQSWLLIFDNLDDISLNSYWPRCLEGSIIVTTQRRAWAHQAVHELQLDAFNEDEGSKLILDLIHPISDATLQEQNSLAARKLSNELGGLPLLLAHIAGYADLSNLSLNELFKMLASPSLFMQLYAYDSTSSTTFQYGEPMKKVWSLTLEALEPSARNALNIIAMLRPDSIKEDMLLGKWDDPALNFLHPDSRIEFAGGIRRNLRDRHLINVQSNGNSSALSIHRAFARHILNLLDDSADPNELDTVFHWAVTIVRRSFPLGSEVQAPTNHTWHECEMYLPHFISLRDIYESRQSKITPSLALAGLFSDAANYLWERALTKDAIETLRIGENMCEIMLTSNNNVVPIYANICAISGAVHAEIGLSGRSLALKKCEKALELRRLRIQHLEASKSDDVTSVDGLLLANGYNDFGVVRLQNEEFAAALDSHLEALKLKERWSSEEVDPVPFGESYKNLSYVRLWQGQIQEAIKLATKSLELHGSSMSELTVSYQKAKSILACVLFFSGERDKALQMHKDILEARKQIVGPGHAISRDSMYMIGEIYRLQKDYPKAEEYFRSSLANAGGDGFPEESIARASLHLSLTIRAYSDKCSPERLHEAIRLSSEAEAFRVKYAPVIPDRVKAESDIRLHDYTVSLWCGRTTGLLGLDEGNESLQ